MGRVPPFTPPQPLAPTRENSTPAPSPAQTGLPGPRKPTSSTGPAFLLAILVLAISWSPRIRVGLGAGIDADIRIQDFLIALLAVASLLRRPFFRAANGFYNQRLARGTGNFLFLGRIPALLVYGGVLVTTLTLILEPDVSWGRRATYFGRGLELLVMAWIVADLANRAGRRKATWAVVVSVSVAAVGNAAWIGYQYATGSKGTLLGSTVGDSIESYGPKLVGEGSPFGTGQFFVFVASVACAVILFAVHQPAIRALAFVMLAVSVFGCWASQSRISLGAIGAVCVTALVVRPKRADRVRLPWGLLIPVFALTWLLTTLPSLHGRLSLGGVEEGLNARTGEIWTAVLNKLSSSPLLGTGPGGLIAPLPIEAHSLALRAFCDFGFIVGSLVLFLLFLVAREALLTLRSPNVNASIRFASAVALLGLLGLVFAGTVQDSLTAVTSSHLAMFGVGFFAGLRSLATIDLNADD